MRRTRLTAALLLAAIAPATRARAQSTAVEEPPATAPAFKRYQVELNPISLGFGRYGPTFQAMPALHAAFVVTPYYRHWGNRGPWTEGPTSSWAAGAEVGHRYYRGRRGMHNFFFGASVIVGYGYIAGGEEYRTSDRGSFFGMAVDVGGQKILWDAWTVSIGVGLQASTEPFIFRSWATLLLPRALFSVGHLF
jgi:hypothetical protein